MLSCVFHLSDISNAFGHYAHRPVTNAVALKLDTTRDKQLRLALQSRLDEIRKICTIVDSGTGGSEHGVRTQSLIFHLYIYTTITHMYITTP